MVFPSTSLPSFEEKILVTRLLPGWICLFPGSIIVDSLGVCCDANCRSFDRAIKENGGRFSAEFVGGVVAVLRVIPVFLLIILYWAIYSQVIVNIFSSPWLKAHLSSFFDRMLSVCRMSGNSAHFHHLLLQNHTANFNQSWHKASFDRGF